jgi:glutamate-1-semialdehyde 2,1-aminomutase
VAAGSSAATLAVPNSPGVTEGTTRDTLIVEYNDVAALESTFKQHSGRIAGVIFEPVVGNMGTVIPSREFLSALRRLTEHHGSLLIFDEVMTGFRVAWGGYQNVCNIRPDITCLGKVIGGGLPVAAYGGSRALMSQVSPLGPMYQAGTLSGNPLGMAAGLATLRLCREPGFYERLHQRSTRLAAGLRNSAGKCRVPIQTAACGGLLGMAFSSQPVTNFDEAKACDHDRFARLYRAMLERGVWLPPSGYEALFISSAHGDSHIDDIIEAANESFRLIAP